MVNSTNKTSKVIQKLFRAIGQLSEDDWEKIADESSTIDIKITCRQKRKPMKDIPTFDGDLSEVVSKLTAFTSREEAQEFLKVNFAARKMLEPIARILDIPISTQDNLEGLRDKITESTVGARLRSQAIQGTGT